MTSLYAPAIYSVWLQPINWPDHKKYIKKLTTITTILEPIEQWLKNKTPNVKISFHKQLSFWGQQKSIQSIFFNIDNIPICQHQIKVIKGNSTYVVGKIPLVTTIERDYWPLKEEVHNVLRHQTGRLLQFNNNATRCYYLNNENTAIPVWKVSFIDKNKPYQAFVDNKIVYKVMPYFFHATNSIDGTISYYKNNYSDELIEEKIKLIGDGTLTTQYFTVDTGNTKRAFSSDHLFIYPPDDNRFVEASVLMYITNMHNFFRILGYNWHDSKPLKVYLHTLVGGSHNNALYTPGVDSDHGFSAIYIGDGDGKTLNNLPLDHDVVSHEFSHHVIFEYLKQTTGDSLILHEGLSDFFTFAKSGDHCLAETVCPQQEQEQGACVLAQCLRSGNTALTYNSEIYQILTPHLKGQLISSFLWDLRTHIPYDTVTQIAYDATKLLTINADIQEYLFTLLITDKERYDSKYGCTIFNAALQRGFATLLEGIDCDNLTATNFKQAKDNYSSNGDDENQQNSTKRSKNKTPFGCIRRQNNKKDDDIDNIFSAFLLGVIPVFNFVKKILK